jgi:hypothetical protein
VKKTGDKGEVEDITEADIISTVEFDHTGDYLATGDKGGRVVLFERNEVSPPPLLYHLWHSHSFIHLKKLFSPEKKDANINFIPSFNPMNLSLIT